MARDDEHVTSLIDQLVDAIAVREAYDPDLPAWQSQRIRELERELAHAWPVVRRDRPRSTAYRVSIDSGREVTIGSARA